MSKPATWLPPVIAAFVAAFVGAGITSVGKSKQPPVEKLTAPAPVVLPDAAKESEVPAIPSSPLKIKAVDVVGYPLDLPAPPPPPANLWSLPLDPGFLYQCQWTAPEGATFQAQFQGALASDLLMESFPPQLGNPRPEVDLATPFVAFRVEPDWEGFVTLSLREFGPDGTMRQKQYYGRTTAFDPTSVELVPGEVLIGLQPGFTASDPQIAALLQASELTKVGELLDGSVVHARSTIEPPPDFLVLHGAVIGDDRVEYAEPNFIAHTMSAMGSTE